jgi:hypothetical protein
MEVLEAVRRFQQNTTALAQDDSSYANAVGDDENAENNHLTGREQIEQWHTNRSNPPRADGAL